MKTYNVTKKDITKKWYLIDATGCVLGRMASRIAAILRGKTKPIYTPALDCGDNVIVINAEKVKLTGNKLKNKLYYRHSTYPGNLKITRAEDYLKRKPEFLLQNAVRGMLPHNSLGRKLLKNLRIYVGERHPHTSQNPEVIKL